METQNNKTLSLSKKIFVGSLAMAALISSLVSCGNNGGGGAPNVPAGSIYTNGIAGATACTACPGNDMIFTA
ncbi:MAG TPA: hypothetical protein VN132_12565, partial [Bdellovibrio sp.]|nr:hypothetical protein [Bdellovibrio sp.]